MARFPGVGLVARADQRHLVLAVAFGVLGTAATLGSVATDIGTGALRLRAAYDAAWTGDRIETEWLRLEVAEARLSESGSDSDRVDASARVRILEGEFPVSQIVRQLLSGVQGSPLDRVEQRFAAARPLIEPTTAPNAAALAFHALASANEDLIALGALSESRRAVLIDTSLGGITSGQHLFTLAAVLSTLCGVVLMGLLTHGTRRLRSEEEARRRVEQRMGFALDAAEVGWWFQDGASRMSGSGKAFEISGHVPIEGMSLAEWARTIVPEDRPFVAETVARAKREGTSLVRYGYRVAHPQLGLRRVVCVGRPVLSGGETVAAHGILWDDTERHALEQDLIAARDVAQQAVATKSRMLAAASHDLRQPLQSMFMFAAALVMDTDPTHRAETAAMLMSAMTTLKSLLDSMVEAARIDSGAIEPRFSDFPIDPLLVDIVGHYRPRAVEKGLVLGLASSGATVRSDPVLLARMIRNLLENALNYTEVGTVEIRARVVNKRVEIEVTDTGRGIPADRHSDIWEEFNQGGGDARRHGEGLGLGLAIVRGLGAALGHEVGLTSCPGIGSTFRIAVGLGQKAEHEPPEKAALPTTPMRVLVLDDDPMVLVGLEVALSLLGHDVIAAEDGGMAAKAVRDWTPQFIIADYCLRDENGVDAVSLVRSLVGFEVPAIILTGEMSGDAEVEATRGGVGIVRKPAPPDELARIMQDMMQAGT